MLYKLGQTQDVFDSMEPVAFQHLPLEKHLENLLADNLAGVLFEDNEMMPIFQERQRQEEADIYALNEQGDLIIFELKRDAAEGGTVYQALRYCETAAHWDFNTLQDKLATYSTNPAVALHEAHRAHFGLEQPLTPSAFNTRQHLVIVGTAGNDDLIRKVDYWKSKGLSITFIPYRVYHIAGDYYFEFFSLPYDRHSNPAHAKGVLFDTCATHIPDSIWYMCENAHVAAFGHQKHVVTFLGKGDIVFLYHRSEGIIAAGRVKSEVKVDNGRNAQYRDLEWLTKPPIQGKTFKAMPAYQIKKVLDRNFFWAKTIKTPYLSQDEREKLLNALKNLLGEP